MRKCLWELKCELCLWGSGPQHCRIRQHGVGWLWSELRRWGCSFFHFLRRYQFLLLVPCYFLWYYRKLADNFGSVQLTGLSLIQKVLVIVFCIIRGRMQLMLQTLVWEGKNGVTHPRFPRHMVWERDIVLFRKAEMYAIWWINLSGGEIGWNGLKESPPVAFLLSERTRSCLIHLHWC